MTLQRRFMAALLRRTISTLPPASRPWGSAMLAELDAISSDGKALLWTLGAIRAACRLRTEAMARASGLTPLLQRGLGVAWTLCGILGLAVVLWGLQFWLTAPPGLDFPADSLFVAAMALALPISLFPATVWALLGLRWRRQADIPVRPTGLGAAVAEIAGIVVMAATWTKNFVLSEMVTQIQGGVVATIADIVALVLLSIQWLVPWLGIVVLLEVFRRGVRKEATQTT